MGLRLNLGSGQRPFQKPWVNVDAQARWNPDLCIDLKQRWPWEDNSAELVVFHHCWEHENCGEAMHFQRESYRVLAPGGSLLVFVPDMRALAQRWLMGQLDTQIYMTNIYGAYMGDEHDIHRWGFTKTTLELDLHRCIWAEVKPFDWRKLEGADIAGPDWWILAMEAIR